MPPAPLPTGYRDGCSGRSHGTARTATPPASAPPLCSGIPPDGAARTCRDSPPPEIHRPEACPPRPSHSASGICAPFCGTSRCISGRSLRIPPFPGAIYTTAGNVRTGMPARPGRDVRFPDSRRLCLPRNRPPKPAVPPGRAWSLSSAPVPGLERPEHPPQCPSPPMPRPGPPSYRIDLSRYLPFAARFPASPFPPDPLIRQPGPVRPDPPAALPKPPAPGRCPRK